MTNEQTTKASGNDSPEGITADIPDAQPAPRPAVAAKGPKKESKQDKPSVTIKTDYTKTTDAKRPANLSNDVAELTATLQRLQADFENYKKRVEKEKQQSSLLAQAKLLQQLLPVMDTFQLALRNTSDHAQFVKGVEMIYAELSAFLQNQGVNHIDTMNKPLNPHIHEVLLKETRTDIEDDTIIEELQKGYTFNGLVLRTSKVKIAKRSESGEHSKEHPPGRHT